MRYSRATAAAIGALMLVLPSAYMVSAKSSGHEEGDPMMITKPDGEETISCAVYFADNMVFAPQWRTDGLVRIEMMIIDMTGFGGDPSSIEDGTINLIENTEIEYGVDYPGYWTTDPETGVEYWDQQKFLLDDSDRLSLTSMVSVSYICVTITEVDEAKNPEDLHTEMFEAGWLEDDAYDRVIFSELGREVNKHGNLIYGMLWDTAADSENPAPAGEYRVDVELGRTVPDGGGYVGEIGTWYDVDFAVGHLYIGDGELLDDQHPYVSLVPDPSEDLEIIIVEGEEPVLLFDDLGVGLGGVYVGDEADTAWILLGQLIPQGPGGGNGGDSGGTGQGHCGENPHE
ncbi:MAG: hypothetical protein JSV94_00025 [Methanobacteriota archaeon]|nr:MAG: hypothetical protein JSV94_00025 [Euryarchaeota archaeon]